MRIGACPPAEALVSRLLRRRPPPAGEGQVCGADLSSESPPPRAGRAAARGAEACALPADAEAVEKPAKEETVVENATPDYAAGLVSTQVRAAGPRAAGARAPIPSVSRGGTCRGSTCADAHVCTWTHAEEVAPAGRWRARGPRFGQRHALRAPRRPLSHRGGRAALREAPHCRCGLPGGAGQPGAECRIRHFWVVGNFSLQSCVFLLY